MRLKGCHYWVTLYILYFFKTLKSSQKVPFMRKRRARRKFHRNSLAGLWSKIRLKSYQQIEFASQQELHWYTMVYIIIHTHTHTHTYIYILYTYILVTIKRSTEMLKTHRVPGQAAWLCRGRAWHLAWHRLCRPRCPQLWAWICRRPWRPRRRPRMPVVTRRLLISPFLDAIKSYLNTEWYDFFMGFSWDVIGIIINKLI